MDAAVRAFLAFCFVLLLTRLIGRRELSSLEPFDLVLLIVVGDLIQQGVTQNDVSFTGLLIAVGMFGVLTLATSYLGFRFRPLSFAAPARAADSRRGREGDREKPQERADDC